MHLPFTETTGGFGWGVWAELSVVDGKKTRKGHLVLRRTKTQALKENAASAADFATALAKDKKFRKQLLSAMGHGAVAQKRAARKIALIATAGRLTHDPKLKREVRKMTQSLEKAWSRSRGIGRQMRTSPSSNRAQRHWSA